MLVRKRFFLLLSCVGILFSREGNVWASLTQTSAARPFFGTVITLKVCSDPDQEKRLLSALNKVWLRFEEIHTLLNTYDPASGLSRLNLSSGQPFVAEQEMADLLRLSQRFSSQTQGAFDVGVGPLIDLWRVCAHENRFPSRKEVLQAKRLIGASVISFGEGGTVFLLPGARITLNAIVPGYAADAGARILLDAGFQDFFVDAGGEIFAAGKNCQGQPWHIGVRDPQAPSGVADIIGIENAAVSTSGDYEKFFTIKGQTYSHIINPLTGYPAAGAVSATVIAPTALEADVWSTALCVLGPRIGFPLINGLGEEYGALFFVKTQTGGLKRYSTSGYNRRRLKKD